METLVQVAAVAAVALGTAFSILGVLGMIRLPDAYTRLHATGKVGVFGVVLLLAGAALATPLGFGKALLLIVLLLIGGPATAHALSSAAYRSGIPFQQSIRNDLEAGSAGLDSASRRAPRRSG